MKPTQLLDALRNIRKEFVAFISIVMIGLLAAVAYLGITYTAAALKKDAASFFRTQGLWDAEIASTMLMTDGDLEAIRALPGIERAEPVWQVDTQVRIGSNRTSVSIMSVPESISQPILLEGRLPETPRECAVEKNLADECALSVGQRLRLECGRIMEVDPLRESDCVITGIFCTPDHISYMVPVTPCILVPKESFNIKGLDGAFMKTRVLVRDTPEDRYSEAYWDTVKPVTEALERLGRERAGLRSGEIRASFEEGIREGEEKLELAAEQLRQGQEKLAEGHRALETVAELLGVGKNMLDYSGQQLNQAEAQYGSVKGEEDELGRLLNLIGEALEFARINYYYAGEEYLDLETRYNNGKKQLEEGERQLAEGQRQYDEAERELNEAKKQFAGIADCRWVVLDNNGNAGYSYAADNSDKLSSLSMSFSSIFLVVGALVIYATVSRMVEQQRKLIGVNKALGIFSGEIFAKYLLFAGSAVLLGVGMGILLAWLPMQRALLASYEAHMNYGEGSRCFLPLETGLVAGGAFAISLTAVYLGCSQLLRQSALSLIQGAQAGTLRRKKSRGSSKRSLYYRLILRNMRTDLNRVLVTIVSIAGGCVLMVVGFWLRYGISGVPDRQFGGIQTYDAEVFFDTAENADVASEIDRILTENGLDHICLRKENTVFELDGSLNALTMIITEKDSLEGYFALTEIDRGEPLALPESGTLAPRRFWEYYDVDVGGDVPVYDTGMNRRTLTLAGVFENYYGQLFFMTPQAYKEAFGSAPEPNCFFVRTEGVPFSVLQERLDGVKGFQRVADAAAERDVIGQFTGSLNFVVYLMLFLAGVMACFIVANFTVTFIQRKTGELTVMRINGFTSGECIRYLAGDLILTTVLGTVVGLVLGGVLGARILSIIETPYIQMLREPRLESFLYSALVTFLFSALTNGFALRRIRRLKLTDVNG